MTFPDGQLKNDLKCTDGRTIRRNAFKDCDGKTVPLVWNHQHNDPSNVLGHALLQNRKDGVYAYCSLNNTPMADNAREFLRHGDVESLSIYANQLKQDHGNVLHGIIREVSLVLAGANPGAFIDNVMLHSDGSPSEDEAYIYTGTPIYNSLEHSFESEEDDTMGDNEGMSALDRYNNMSEEDQEAVNILLGAALSEREDEQDDEDEYDDEEYDDEEYDDEDEYDDDEEYDDEDEYDEEDYDMNHNVFEGDSYDDEAFLSHSDQSMIIEDAKRMGSLKEAFLAHANAMGFDDDVLMHSTDVEYSQDAQDYFVNDPSFLFPEARAVSNVPAFISRRTDWVAGVMSGVKHTPFSRIKTMFADITEDEARAKGYIKGKMKKEEVFSLLKRTTTPTTIYKKQKMDRDDVLDITDFDVVSWIRAEMRVMLDEEIARAILIGDGRLNSSDDKINESCVRPIWKDVDLFTIKKDVTFDVGATDDQKAKAVIKAAVKARKDYRGSGNPVLYTTEDWLTDMLLMEDQIGHRLYKDAAEVASAMRVSRIITVQVFENQVRTDADGNRHELIGIIVNLNDYRVGADKGGQINMFDGFDIDYNQQKYLLETRISGALDKPYSAIVLETPVA